MSETAQPVTEGVWKYTDRDVREDPRLTELALTYLQETGNEFEPIVQAQRLLRSGQGLTVAQVRVVLNCMRHDFRLNIEMPIPDRPLYVVPEMKVKKQKVRIDMPAPKKCTRTDVHEPHYLDETKWGKNNNYCNGVKNDRPRRLDTPVKIKVGYIKGKQGMQMHAPHPHKNHHIERYPNPYGEGFLAHFGGLYDRQDSQMIVHTVCRTPGRLTNPMLLTFEEALEIVGTAPLKIHPDKVITWCKTCFAGILDEEDDDGELKF